MTRVFPGLVIIPMSVNVPAKDGIMACGGGVRYVILCFPVSLKHRLCLTQQSRLCSMRWKKRQGRKSCANLDDHIHQSLPLRLRVNENVPVR